MSQIMSILLRGDERALFFLVARRRPALDATMRAVTHLGDAAVTIGAVLALLLTGVAALVVAGAMAAFALTTSHVVVQLLKRSVNRPRPRLPQGLESLVAAPDRFSFPSGHAASSLSVALAVATLLSAPAGALVVGVALLVGTTRCYLGVHYPGDVLVGWLLALLGMMVARPALALLGM